MFEATKIFMDRFFCNACRFDEIFQHTFLGTKIQISTCSDNIRIANCRDPNHFIKRAQILQPFFRPNSPVLELVAHFDGENSPRPLPFYLSEHLSSSAFWQ